MIEEMNKDATLISAKIRLYASAEVYNIYWQLIQWSAMLLFAVVVNGD